MGKWKHRLSGINADDRTATCSNCGKVRIKSIGRGFWGCKNRTNEQSRKDKYKAKYNNPTAYKSRPSTCEICGGTTRIAYDHCHKTGIFRGWLCMKCNTALGLVKDDIILLEKMIDYLKREPVKLP